jgi:uncharacterized membrane protein YbaN (DUF454 family)
MKAGRALYLAAGLVAVGIGIVGVVTPGLPGTVFLIVALFCFKRSSPRLERWLLEHPRLGPTLRDWELHRSIRPRTKVVAIVLMWAFIGSTFFAGLNPWIEALLVALGAYGTWYIASRPSVVPGPVPGTLGP